LFIGTIGDRLRSMDDAFREFLGGVPLHVSHQGIFSFVTKIASHTGGELLFPHGHPFELQERYAWFLGHRVGPRQWEIGRPVRSFREEPTYVKFGWLKPDQDGSILEEEVYASGRRAAENDRTGNRRAQIHHLKAAGLLTAEQADHELAQLGATTESKETYGAD
jgi:hypothetical protein